MKILIVEDDTLLLQGLILAAQTEGYACDGVTTARMAEQSLEAGHYSLVVLDLGLPDEDGLHFLARIRQKKYTLPVLILTARDTLTDKIAGLDVGADDYLVKPFALEELHARIRALLRRHNNQGESELIVGNLTLNMGRRQVWMGGEELILTPKEYALLSRLMLKAGSPVHREILYNDIYNWDNEPSTNTLEVHIHNLRDFLRRPISLRQRLILTIGAILLVFELISVFWLWHESTEQIQLFEQALRDNRNNDRHIMREIREAVASLIVPGVFMVSLTLFICYQAVRRITRPLAELQKELEARTADNLTPIAIHSATLEIEAVVSALNDLVSRLTSTLDNERLFTADVAHELRTPLAGVRLHLELLAKTHHIDVAPLVARLDQMMESVSQLLQLARAGQSFSSGNYQHVKLLEDVILPSYDELSTMLDQRQQTLLLPESAADITVQGDATLLRMLLRNLVENAHRYSPQGSNIMIKLQEDGGAVMAVEDEGPGIDESKCGELSKAFVRMDSRYGGIGLGLSIVSRITQLHHGQFFLQNRQETSGTRAWVRLKKDQNVANQI
ncbi:MAG: two-component system sensor histidine kinase PmrB [Escherichia coli]|nr:two-component system sensor histidine kinase PmrB [Escherichia coli]